MELCSASEPTDASASGNGVQGGRESKWRKVNFRKDGSDQFSLNSALVDKELKKP